MHERSSFKFDFESLFLMWSYINLHNSMCLFWAAKWSGVQPSSFSGFFALIFLIICLHIFKWPFSAAKWSGVSPVSFWPCQRILIKSNDKMKLFFQWSRKLNKIFFWTFSVAAIRPTKINIWRRHFRNIFFLKNEVTEK